VTFEELGNLGELIAAIATVATLAYLATQIRYACLAASDTSRQSRAEGVRDMLTLMIDNPETRAAWFKADPGDERGLGMRPADEGAPRPGLRRVGGRGARNGARRSGRRKLTSA
jgi:hypothetical protein